METNQLDIANLANAKLYEHQIKVTSKEIFNMENKLTKAKENSFLNLKDFNINVISEELDGLNMTFEKIKIPSAGNINFKIPGVDSNEPETVKEFTGVILYHHPIKAYYNSKYTGENNPPDCVSCDGKTGKGIPGGTCNCCKFSQLGSGENGGRACKDRRRIYVLCDGELLPHILLLPTGSLNEFTKYLKRLLSKGKKSNSIVTKFSLKKAINNSGITYSKVQFYIDRDLTEEEIPLIVELSEQIKEYSQKIEVD